MLTWPVSGFIALAARCAWGMLRGLCCSPGLFLQSVVMREPASWCYRACGGLSDANILVSKLHARVVALCFHSGCRARRLLQERSPALHGLPRRWLAHLLGRAAAPGQSRDDILRRSAGLPAAIVALFLAEPANQARKVRGTQSLCLLALRQCTF